MRSVSYNLIALVLFLLCDKSFAQENQDNTKSNEAYYLEITAKATKLALAQDEQWKLLLHYNGNRSAIKDDYFFLAKDGNKNPDSELSQTIKEFFRTDLPLDNNHVICRYPARLKWLTQKLQIDGNYLPKPNCSELRTYLKNTGAQEISIIFASENVNNLMSMMGHIFLKISGQRNGSEVSHSLGYFANFSKEGPISFIFGALFSGTSGIYILEPYQKKMQEYNNKQKRSIWEYKLNLNPDQIEILVLHIWEMKRANAKYNFITHNCGSALLYLLYVTDPNLQKIYSKLDAPIDIIKNLNEAGYISNIEVSPSDSYRFRMISDNFTTSDRSIIKSFIKSEDINLLKNYESPQKQSNLLAGVKTVIDYQVLNGDLDQDQYDSLRVKIDDLSTSLPKNNLALNIKNPLKKNASSRASLGYKNQGNNSDYINFGFYPIYNSLNENNSEYFNEFELQLANLEGGYYTNSNRFKLDNFDLIKMKNIIPYDSFVDGISGSFKINFERERFDAESNKIFPNINLGPGLGKNILNNKILAYSIAGFGYSYFRGNNIAYSNPEIGAIFKEGNFGKLNARYVRYFSSNSYKYRNLTALEQTFFIKEHNDLLFSYKIIHGDIEKSFRSLSLEYQHHF